jgi:xanthine/CO dehydrogenase XdhC/CoxF family maturation factor
LFSSPLIFVLKMSKEIEQIIRKINSLAPGAPAILATVVDLEGSGYRRPGARMLMDENGKSVGTVSGGCLEADVLERAQKVLRTGESIVITYDTAKDENSPFGLGMGCRGVVRILLEAVERKSILARAFQRAYEYRHRQFVATMISSSRAVTGGRIFYGNAEQFYFENLPDEVERSVELKNDCLEFFAQNKTPEIREYEIGTDRFELFFENIEPPLNLLLFGAGSDALPLAALAKGLGWSVTLIDHRAAWANAERFPEAEEIVVSRAENLPPALFSDEAAIAVVMTHNYEADKKILSRLLNSDCRYIGALGPKKRTEKILGELSDAGENFTPDRLERLYAPVGLDIGAVTPEAIALSIVAEIQSVLAGRNGGFLRLRQGGIYDRHRDG